MENWFRLEEAEGKLVISVSNVREARERLGLQDC